MEFINNANRAATLSSITTVGAATEVPQETMGVGLPPAQILPDAVA